MAQLLGWKKQIVENFENRINKYYDDFYIYIYESDEKIKYGVFIDSFMVSRCDDLNALEQVINVIEFLLEKQNGGYKEWQQHK